MSRCFVYPKRQTANSPQNQILFSSLNRISIAVVDTDSVSSSVTGPATIVNRNNITGFGGSYIVAAFYDRQNQFEPAIGFYMTWTMGRNKNPIAGFKGRGLAGDLNNGTAVNELNIGVKR